MRTQRAVFGLLCAVVGLAGCGEGGLEPEAACLDDPAPNRLPDATDRTVVGQVRIFDVWDRKMGDDGIPKNIRTGRVAGGFVDLSARTSTPSAVMQIGPFCAARISRSESSGAKAVSLDSLMLQQTVRGDIAAEARGAGTFVETGEPILPVGDVRIVGVGTSSTSFPSFDVTMPAPMPLDLLTPAVDGTEPIELGEMTVSWTPGDGDFILLVIIPDQVSVQSGGDLTCVLPDDGCFVLPTAAAVALLANDSDTFTLQLSRHRYQSLELDPDAFLETETISRVDGTLKKGVAQ